jgi:cytidyltransferase-like protein
MKITIVSGYFNPLHKGHIEYFTESKKLGDHLFVIVNNDHQRELKGSKEFQDEQERMLIVSSLGVVDKAILSIDKDRTVRETLKLIHQQFGKDYELCFTNGGDQNNQTIPERATCDELGITLVDGLGEKIQSSSWLLS